MAKEWWEKEEEFEQRYYQGRHCKNLWRFIPKKLMDAVDDVAVDSDGYWIYLSAGWNMDGDRIIHAHTIADIKEDLKRIEVDRI